LLTDENKSLEKEIAEFYFGWEKECHHATEEEIDELGIKSGRPIPTALKDIWLIIPGKHPDATCGPRGFGGGGEVNLTLPTPTKLLVKLADSGAYDHLKGLGILNYLNWIWGNDHSFLNIEADAKPDDKRVIADSALTCFGHLSDGHCESNLVLHYDKNEVFGATFWSQDDQYIPLKPTFTGFETPEALILKCLAGCDVIDNHPDQEDPESPYASVEMVTEWMETGDIKI